jgi:two-component system CheB/CheR fusion protein
MDDQATEGADFLVVGIGASAGGLDAAKLLFDALPAQSFMAFVLVQHLDPNHDSLMAELLAGHTSLTVLQATEGMKIEPEHVYLIPPGAYLTVTSGALAVSRPQGRHGVRLPFDHLLGSLASEFGSRAVCIILSGTGADGSIGLKAIKEECGLVIAQAPDEADYDGMPQNAVLTGQVDLILPAAAIPAALEQYRRRMAVNRSGKAPDQPQDWLPDIVDLLRTNTPHDFTLYRPGTLQRRIERRMALAAIESDDMDRYLELLRGDPVELERLAKDLLINVTSFFRDPKVFDLLAEKIVPDMLAGRGHDNPVRIWIAGCSSGEETYSLAMLFREQITALRREIKVQIFASDVDADAITTAREGFYPATIEADVGPARLARFFTKEEHGYRIVPDLRSMVVFTVQDVLADPPFARLDMVSCRNLLIYLKPEAQAKVIAVFHFALRDAGVLLLGSAETPGAIDGKFEVIAKAQRLYRRIGGRSRPEELRFGSSLGSVAALRRPVPWQAGARPAVLADLCRRLVVETYAPASVLINRQYESLFSLGPTDRYLKVVSGHVVNDLLSMARDGVRTKLRSAIQRAIETGGRAVIGGGQMKRDGVTVFFSIAAQPVKSDGEDLILISFEDEAEAAAEPVRGPSSGDSQRIRDLQQELEASRSELQDAIRNLEASGEDQKAVTEEALSVNEEFQATNEELLASKEELQSLNEELTALNGQLQETLELQRKTSNDLENVLYSTDVATIFLDTDLKIRFFTPATRQLFRVIPTDLGRPLSDLSPLAADPALPTDVKTVLRTQLPVDREILAHSGAWFLRRVLPYRTRSNSVDGVVITYVDVTERKQVADALEAAKEQAQLANVAKSRFLAAASHDLRQPMQTLALLHGLLAKTVEGDHARRLIGRFDETLSAMTSMLNALLDVNQIEAGTVRAEIVSFPVGELLARLGDEFTYHAQARQLDLRVVPSSVMIQSDPGLLEQMIRNLLSNAQKYTSRGKVLVGCRRRRHTILIEILDTGIGIPDDELQTIFDEYQQVDNPARESGRGLGLGLSIVRRLGALLGHPVRVRSELGRGSVFSIEVKRSPLDGSVPRRRDAADDHPVPPVRRTGRILIVEDDPEVRDLLAITLTEEGHQVVASADGGGALDRIGHEIFQPDLVLADYNLPNEMNGLELAARLRDMFHRPIPTVILTGNISHAILRNIAAGGCIHIDKPVKLKALVEIIQRLLPVDSTVNRRPVPPSLAGRNAAMIYVVDDDFHARTALREMLAAEGMVVEDFSSCEAFLAAYRPGSDACLLIDAYLPGMSGLDLLRQLAADGISLPSVMITGNSDVKMAVQAMKAGAADFIEKPVGRKDLLAAIERALEQSRDSGKRLAWKEDAVSQLAGLTPRQREILALVLAGHPSKNIAADLGISQRTVENHRASIMKKTGSHSLPALARLALTAAGRDTPETEQAR